MHLVCFYESRFMNVALCLWYREWEYGGLITAADESVLRQDRIMESVSGTSSTGIWVCVCISVCVWVWLGLSLGTHFRLKASYWGTAVSLIASCILCLSLWLGFRLNNLWIESWFYELYACHTKNKNHILGKCTWNLLKHVLDVLCTFSGS